MEPRLCAIWIAAHERARRLVREMRPVATAPPKMRRKAATNPKKPKYQKQLDLFK